MISMDDLRIVIAVAKHGSFVTAARRTGVPTSSVSRMVARMECSLGIRIFHRTSRRVTLTDEGMRLIDRCASLLGELENAVEELADRHGELSGKLRVTAPILAGTNLIAPALLSFAEAHPHVSVEISVSNSIADLVVEGFDLAFRGGPILGPDLVARRVWSEAYAISASSTFIARELGGRTTIDAEQLRRAPAILARQGASWRFLRGERLVFELHPEPRFVVNDLRVAVKAAQRGLGIVRVPEALADQSGLIRLQLAPDLGMLEPRTMYAVYPTRHLVPKRVHLAIEWVTRSVQASLGRPTMVLERRAL